MQWAEARDALMRRTPIEFPQANMEGPDNTQLYSKAVRDQKLKAMDMYGWKEDGRVYYACDRNIGREDCPTRGLSPMGKMWTATGDGTREAETLEIQLGIMIGDWQNAWADLKDSTFIEQPCDRKPHEDALLASVATSVWRQRRSTGSHRAQPPSSQRAQAELFSWPRQ